MKKAIALIIILALAMSLASCGGAPKDDMHTLVQGNLDAVYKGKASEEYLQIVDSTPEEAKRLYLDGLDTEAEFFCYYFGIVDHNYDETYEDTVTDETKSRIIDMYKQIYEKSKYDIKESVKQNDGNYTVQAIIYPIDIMEKAIDVLYGEYAPFDELNAKYDVDTSTLSDEQLSNILDQYVNDYANLVIDCILDLLPNLDYKEPKSISVQVQADEAGIFSINDADFTRIDDYIIYYP